MGLEWAYNRKVYGQTSSPTIQWLYGQLADNQLADRPTCRQLNWPRKPTRRNWNCHQNRCNIFWTHGRVFVVILPKKKLATRCRCDCCQQRRRHGHKDGIAKLRRVPKARELRRPRRWSPHSRLGSLGERRKLPQLGLGRSPSRYRILFISFPILCILNHRNSDSETGQLRKNVSPSRIGQI